MGALTTLPAGIDRCPRTLLSHVSCLMSHISHLSHISLSCSLPCHTPTALLSPSIHGLAQPTQPRLSPLLGMPGPGGLQVCRHGLDAGTRVPHHCLSQKQKRKPNNIPICSRALKRCLLRVLTRNKETKPAFAFNSACAHRPTSALLLPLAKPNQPALPLAPRFFQESLFSG